jgi:hypothetical protein
MRDIQKEDGRFPNVAPLGAGFGETMWGSTGITVAWESYQQYGDADMLRTNYNAMKSYIEYFYLNKIREQNLHFKDVLVRPDDLHPYQMPDPRMFFPCLHHQDQYIPVPSYSNNEFCYDK